MGRDNRTKDPIFITINKLNMTHGPNHDTILQNRVHFRINKEYC